MTIDTFHAKTRRIKLVLARRQSLRLNLLRGDDFFLGQPRRVGQRLLDILGF
jgi:hypothetical protein